MERPRSVPRGPGRIRGGRSHTWEEDAVKARDRWKPPNLKGRVAVVSGASRGGGRGIALVLGESGAVVYVSGRSTRDGSRTRGFPWTVEQTVDLIRERGGSAVPHRCDHSDPLQVRKLFSRVRREQGHLDILVNNAWGGYERNDGGLPEGALWEQPLRHWEGMFENGLKSTFLSCYFGIPLMLPQRRGLIVNTLAWDRGKYLGNLFYDVAKQATRRLSYGLALEVKGRGLTVLALAPGFMRTELVMKAHRRRPFDLTMTESPEYVGRAVACLASDTGIASESGAILEVGTVAKKYRFTDIDGRWVPPFRIPDDRLLD